jgi:hypothetical protein
VAQLQEKSFRNYDYESEVIAGEGVAIFENRKMVAENGFFSDGERDTPRVLASWGDCW